MMWDLIEKPDTSRAAQIISVISKSFFHSKLTSYQTVFSEMKHLSHMSPYNERLAIS